MHDNKLRCYVLGVVLNEVIRISKENKKYFELREEFFEDEGYNIIEEVDMSLMYEEAVKVIENLDTVYSMTLFFRYQQGLKPNEIAEKMDVPVKTVYTRLSRAEMMLRDALLK